MRRGKKVAEGAVSCARARSNSDWLVCAQQQGQKGHAPRRGAALWAVGAADTAKFSEKEKKRRCIFSVLEAKEEKAKAVRQ